jgi:hypothetical protein
MEMNAPAFLPLEDPDPCQISGIENADDQAF